MLTFEVIERLAQMITVIGDREIVFIDDHRNMHIVEAITAHTLIIGNIELLNRLSTTNCVIGLET